VARDQFEAWASFLQGTNRYGQRIDCALYSCCDCRSIPIENRNNKTNWKCRGKPWRDNNQPQDATSYRASCWGGGLRESGLAWGWIEWTLTNLQSFSG